MNNPSIQSTCRVHSIVFIGVMSIATLAQSVYAAAGSTTIPAEEWYRAVLFEPFNRVLELELDETYAVEATGYC